MTSIEINVDVSTGTLKTEGRIDGGGDVRVVLKDYARHVLEDSRIRVFARELVVAETVGFSEDGDDAVAFVSMDGEGARKLKGECLRPAQVGVVIVVDSVGGEAVPCKGRSMLLVNWGEVPGGGGDRADPGSVPITDVSELPSRYRDTDMRNKVNELVRIISGRAVALAAILAPAALFGAGITVSRAQKDQIWNDEPVVTNVTFDATGLVTSLEPATNYTDAVADAARAYVDGKVLGAARDATNYTDAAKAEIADDISSAAAGAVDTSKAYTDAKVGAIVIPEYDLSIYAQKVWVESKGYVAQEDLAPYATKNWVAALGFVTRNMLDQYATMSWVNSQGFAKSSDLDQYATKGWVDGKDFAQKEWVNEKITDFARALADTNGVTRLWSHDGSLMMDATGVVWDVTWRDAVKWTSLSNGVVYTETTEGTLVGNGVVTNKAGKVGIGYIVYPWGAGKAAFFIDGFAADKEILDMSGMYIGKDGAWEKMKADSFTGTVERVASFTYHNRFAWITEAGGGGGDIHMGQHALYFGEGSENRIESTSGDDVSITANRVFINSPDISIGMFSGQTFDFTDNRVLYTALSNILIRLGGSVVNFPDFQ